MDPRHSMESRGSFARRPNTGKHSRYLYRNILSATRRVFSDFNHFQELGQIFG
jgi:hypothetical protein